MKLFKTLLLAFICLHSSSIYAQQEIGLPIIQNYKIGERGVRRFFSMTQDSTGVLYFCGQDGVYNFDGKKFNLVYDVNSGFQHAFSVKYHSNGNIFVGLGNGFGYLKTDETGKKAFVSLTTGRGFGEIGIVWSIEINGDWVYFNGSGKDIFVYNVKSEVVKKISTAQKFNRHFATDGERFFLNTKSGDLWELVKDTLILTKFESNFNVTGFIPLGGKKSLIVTSSNGLLLGNVDSASPPVPIKMENSKFLGGNLLSGATKINANTFCLGSQKGVIIIDTLGHQLAEYNSENGLLDNGAARTFLDRDANLWVLTDAGISNIPMFSNVQIWDSRNGLKGFIEASVRFNGLLYVATRLGVYQLDPSGICRKVEGITPGGDKFFLLLDDNGKQKLLASDAGMGIYEIEGLRSKQLLNSNTRWMVQPRLFQGRILVQNEQQVEIYQYHHGSLVFEGRWHVPFLVGNLFNQMKETQTGRLFYCMKDKLVEIIPGKLISDQPHIVEYNQRAYFVSILNGEAILYPPGGFKRFNQAKNTIEPFCDLGQLFCDGSSNPIFVSSAGQFSAVAIADTVLHKHDVFKIERKDGHLEITNKPFQKVPGFGLNISHLMVEKDGTFWVGIVDKLFCYRGKNDLKNYKRKFKCLVSKVSINSDSVINYGLQASQARSFKKPELSFDNTQLKFEFAAPFFDKAENTKYAYQLVGYDKDWSAWSTDPNFKEYTNLPEGSYTFQVKALNIYGIESSTGTYQFAILPPWYRTWWAYSLQVAAFGLGVFGVIRWQIAVLIRRNKKMEQIVKARTEELRANREELILNNQELSATLEKLTETQRQLIESEKMASIGQLTAGIAHEINNPINFISGGVQALEDLLQPLFDREIELSEAESKELEKDVAELLQVVNKGVNRTSAIISGLRNYAGSEENINTSIDIKGPIDDALQLIQSKIVDAHVGVTVELNHHSAVKANSGQISQVIMNMVDNAIYAVKKNTEKKIVIRTEEVGSEVLIKIKDNGEGIPEEIQNEILNPFFTTKAAGQGTGLGLSISYSIITRHGGKLSLTSQPNVGTEFCIALPIES
jgi:signal transduction histidine kinase